MSNHSEICPVCKGSGKYKEYWDYNTTTGASYEHTCHGCNGKGWVVVPDVDNGDFFNRVTYKYNISQDANIDTHIPHID